MRYMLQRMEAERQVCTDVETTSLKEGIEAVFSPGNIDDDCDRIAGLLYPYKVQIGEMLDKGEYHEAFTLFYEILESLSYHLLRMSIIATLMICTVLTIPAETCLMLSSGR